MADSTLIAHVLRLLTSRPQGIDKLLPLVLALALGEEEIKAETGTVYLCDPLDSLEAGRAVARFATRVFMTTEGRPTVYAGPPPSLARFEEGHGSVAGWVLANGEAHVSPDCQTCELYMRSPSDPQFKSLMCFPIIYGRMQDDRPKVLGIVNLHTKQSSRAWSSEHVQLIEPWVHITALAILANHHELTMLPNRPFSEHLLAELMSRRRPLHLAYIDLDHFGKVNEEFGHRPANEIIQRFAAVLKRNAGDGVTVCHMHGDEFVLLIENKTREEALAKAHGILAQIRDNQNSFRVGDQTVSSRIGTHLTATVGLAEWEQGMEAHELIDAADKANAEQKHRRRGRVRATWAENR